MPDTQKTASTKHRYAYHLPHPKPMNEVLDALFAPVPQRLIETRPAAGGSGSIQYISVHNLKRLLDYCTAGWWEKETVSVTTDVVPFIVRRPDRTLVREERAVVTVVVKLTVYGIDDEGRTVSLSRTDSGEAIYSDLEYGEAVTRAEAQAFRRACAAFGLGLELWG